MTTIAQTVAQTAAAAQSAAQSATVIKPRDFAPKRGFKSVTMTVKDTSIACKPHHQKTLILEILDKEETHSMSLEEMVKRVEADEKLWSRLQSKQSVFNCISYHMKDLGKLGILEVK